MRARAGSIARTALGTAAVIGVSLLGATLVGAHGGDIGMIHGCYGADHLLRIVDPNVDCTADETTLDWPRYGIAGPSGRPGSDGPAGPAGLAGPPGPAGADGQPLAFREVSRMAAGPGRHVVAAPCPDGQQAAGASWRTQGGPTSSSLENAPLAGNRGWRVAAGAGGAGAWTLTVTALCTRAPGVAAEAAFRAGRPAPAACGPACLPREIALADAIADGVPVVVPHPGRAATVVVSVTCSSCRRAGGRPGPGLGRAVRRHVAGGTLKVPVPVSASAARRLAAVARARVLVHVTITPRAGKPARVTRRVTVRR